MATDFGGPQPPYKKIEEIEFLDDPEKWFDNLDEDTEFAAYDGKMAHTSLVGCSAYGSWAYTDLHYRFPTGSSVDARSQSS